jgi:hypothetical protein
MIDKAKELVSKKNLEVKGTKIPTIINSAPEYLCDLACKNEC